MDSMKTTRTLAPGQLWKTREAAFEILALGTSLTHYRVIRLLGSEAVSAQISGIEALQNYLRLHGAELVRARAR